MLSAEIRRSFLDFYVARGHSIVSPTLGQFEGIDVYIGNLDHPPPHVHVYYAGHRASAYLEDPVHIEGRLPAAQRRKAIEWITENLDYLRECWQKREQGQPVPKKRKKD